MLRRKIRLERRSILLLADGSTLTLDPGHYVIHLEDARPMIAWRSGGLEQRAAIDGDEIGRHLARRDFVYTSW